MTKETWIRHIEETAGISRPDKYTYSGVYSEQLATWKAAVAEHKAAGPCKACAERQKTRKRSAAARFREDAYRSCGMTKVIGSVSGSVYWE